jgi:hypothetical protein
MCIITNLYVKEVISQLVEQQAKSIHHEKVRGERGIHKEQIKHSRSASRSVKKEYKDYCYITSCVRARDHEEDLLAGAAFLPMLLVKFWRSS